MSLKIKNEEVKYLAELLYSLTLKGKKSRWRTKLFDLLAHHYNVNVTPQLNQLAKDYAELDDNNELVYMNKEKSRVKVYDEYYEEANILLNEEFIIECNELNKIMILTNARILLDGEFDVSPSIASMYDKWCEKFEVAIDYYEGLED